MTGTASTVAKAMKAAAMAKKKVLLASMLVVGGPEEWSLEMDGVDLVYIIIFLFLIHPGMVKDTILPLDESKRENNGAKWGHMMYCVLECMIFIGHDQPEKMKQWE